MNSADIELAVSNYFDWRRNIIVTNIAWGLRLHECDLIVLTPTGRAYEVEIKVSKSDLKADLKKDHAHQHKKISRLYFAVPAKLLAATLELCPQRAGILSCHEGGYVDEKRKAETVGNYCFTPDECFQLARLGNMRTWGLRSTIRHWVRDKEYQRRHDEIYDLPEF